MARDKFSFEGLDIVYDKDVFNDFEVLELVAEIEDNELKIIPLMKKVFKDEYGRIKEHFRDKDGKVSVDGMTRFIEAFFSTCAKN